ncbi:DNA repair protein [Bradyrhizobium sp. NAS80.1]|nr:DNA repair protein [Bradyrhizobium sp. NAS80.1]
MTKANPSALDIILDWSQDRPAWQRDALRRIVVNGSLSDTDITDLVALCKQDHGGPAATSVSARHLEKQDLPANPGARASIALASLSGVEGVNQLSPNQTLPFETKGLTVVYGDNGAGKSGYARILKRACRARFPGEIMPDAYAGAAVKKAATAAIGYEQGGKVKPAVQWNDNGAPHAILSAVSVFDRECAAVHVRDKNEVAFRPFGLDIPDELADACQRIKTALSAEQALLEAARDGIFAKPTWKPTTSVGRFMASLNSGSNIADLEKLSNVTNEDRARHQRLSEDLAKDPKKASSEQVVYADELRALSAVLSDASSSADDATLKSIQDLRDAAVAKRQAASVAAKETFQASLLAGVDSQVWRTLWEAARRYSEEMAYIGAHFPRCDDGSACVLCQQPLSSEAQTRLRTFEAFVQSDVELQAKNAEAEFSAALRGFDSKKIRLQGPARRRIAIEDPTLGADIIRFLASARYRRQQCRRAIDQKVPANLAKLEESPLARVRALELSTRKYAAELLEAVDVAGRARLEAERDELADRLSLPALIDKAKAEITRLRALRLIAACISDTSTAAITKLGNLIADEVITPRMRDRFQQEIVRLAADRVRVEIVRAGGKYGSPVYQIRLFANKDARVHNVLSEGEQTCVALAAFLSELATASHQSALVFDDPVSSLDHRWRDQVARRLVDEAANRQVIVFTHDLVFVNDLTDAADQSKTPVLQVSLSRGPSGAGVVASGLPWAAAKVRDRVDKMEKDVRAAKVLYDKGDETAYKEEVHRIYSNLRRTWERAIEDVAFHGVILRHRDYVNTKYLRKATALTPEDCDGFDKGFQKCCDQTDAHDPSRGRNAAPPSPDELLKDVQAVRIWADDIRARQNKIN